MGLATSISRHCHANLRPGGGKRFDLGLLYKRRSRGGPPERHERRTIPQCCGSDDAECGRGHWEPVVDRGDKGRRAISVDPVAEMSCESCRGDRTLGADEGEPLGTQSTLPFRMFLVRSMVGAKGFEPLTPSV